MTWAPRPRGAVFVGIGLGFQNPNFLSGRGPWPPRVFSGVLLHRHLDPRPLHRAHLPPPGAGMQPTRFSEKDNVNVVPKTYIGIPNSITELIYGALAVGSKATFDGWVCSSEICIWEEASRDSGFSISSYARGNRAFRFCASAHPDEKNGVSGAGVLGPPLSRDFGFSIARGNRALSAHPGEKIKSKPNQPVERKQEGYRRSSAYVARRARYSVVIYRRQSCGIQQQIPENDPKREWVRVRERELKNEKWNAKLSVARLSDHRPRNPGGSTK
ncbi:hypothetical protein C8F04DRAFT_1304774 [Mycena alexandri]|uniref:Uncharacterized protein n=1 Tax=Mycena alexandri TaxID=1745969 RepID=A0AAD6S979_9AGAR|nr:hypothetical protein C8F04DRAFT_1304774 [Mycena alexandri]